jgi:hypothetical protein
MESANADEPIRAKPIIRTYKISLFMMVLPSLSLVVFGYIFHFLLGAGFDERSSSLMQNAKFEP